VRELTNDQAQQEQTITELNRSYTELLEKHENLKSEAQS
jgi:hypothetical protein